MRQRQPAVHRRQLPLKDGKLAWRPACSAATSTRPPARRRRSTAPSTCWRRQRQRSATSRRSAASSRSRSSSPRPPDFTEQHLVANGASDFLVAALGRARQARALGGRHGRAAAERAGRGRSHHRSRLRIEHERPRLADRAARSRIAACTIMNRTRLGEHALGLRQRPSSTATPSNATSICRPMACRSSSMTTTCKRLTGDGRLRLAAHRGRTWRAAASAAPPTIRRPCRRRSISSPAACRSSSNSRASPAMTTGWSSRSARCCKTYRGQGRDHVLRPLAGARFLPPCARHSGRPDRARHRTRPRSRRISRCWRTTSPSSPTASPTCRTRFVDLRPRAGWPCRSSPGRSATRRRSTRPSSMADQMTFEGFLPEELAIA